MEYVNIYMPMILYVLIVVALVLLIIIGFKVLKITNEIEELTKDVKGKVSSLNSFFKALDKGTDKLSLLSEGAFDNVVEFLKNKLEKSKNKEEENEER